MCKDTEALERYRDAGHLETKQSFDGQLYQEYSYQNLLQLDHFSSSYDEKNFGVFFSASQCVCLFHHWLRLSTKKKLRLMRMVTEYYT